MSEEKKKRVENQAFEELDIEELDNAKGGGLDSAPKSKTTDVTDDIKRRM